MPLERWDTGEQALGFTGVHQANEEELRRVGIALEEQLVERRDPLGVLATQVLPRRIDVVGRALLTEVAVLPHPDEDPAPAAPGHELAVVRPLAEPGTETRA